MSNAKFISAINEQINPLVTSFAGAKIYGIAQAIIGKGDTGDELIPCLVDKDGEGKYVGVDDTAPITIYHKSNSISVSDKQNSGTGDSRADKVYLYANTMIVFLDRKKTLLMPDELVLLIQANLADAIKIPNYKSVNVRIQNIILNTQQVFASEYQNTPYKIPPRFSLFAINYQIESTFDKKCFAKCP